VRKCFLSIAFLLSLVHHPAHAGNWPQFRGPTGLGYSDEDHLPLTWDRKTGKNIAWQVGLPKSDNAYSSPIVWADRIFVTCVNEPVEHRVVCYDQATGGQLWETKIDPGPLLLKDLRGGYGAPTPATDGQSVFVAFGSAVIAAVDFNGKVVWRKELATYNFDVAMASSPIIYKDTVILLCDQVGKTSNLLAFDKQTGQIKWEQQRPQVGFSHSTPVVIQVEQKDQLVVSASNALQGVDPTTGTMIWWCSAYGDAASPAWESGLIYCDSGRGGKGVAVDPSGKGDVSKTHVKWIYPQIPEGLSSPIIAKVGTREASDTGTHGYIYRTHNPETLKCIDSQNGHLIFAERLPGVSTWASPFSDKSGRIYFASAGKTYVITPGPKLITVATNDLADESRCSAAVSNGQIFLRGSKNLYCIAEK